MVKALFRKLLEIVPTIVGVAFFAFLLIRLAPGDPVQLLMGERGSDPQRYHEMRALLGLDKPYYEQFGNFLQGALTGDLGQSITTHRAVSDEFFSRWPATFELGALALLIAVVCGIPMGVLAAIRRNSLFDFTLMGASLVGYSMPIFWWGMMLIITFSIQLGWTPVSGRIDVLYDINPWTGFLLIDCLQADVLAEYGLDALRSALAHLLLPATAMATIPLAVFARMTRSSVLEVLGEDYMRTARAKGLGRFKVVAKHALRNALVPVITVGGILFISTVITGAILTETIFSWPGVGSYIVASVNARDYPVIQACVLLMGVTIVSINTLVEMLYMWANPRMRS